MSKKISFFLDSGAFSAYMKKVEINIDDYIKFIKENREYIDVYANLDVIRDPEGTLKNQKYMESKGLNPIPTYHLMSDFKYLEYYANNYDYIAIGGLAIAENRTVLVSQLDEVFRNYICNKDGFPKIKTHGFGVTSHELLLRYPWYSVDSTSWNVCARFGGLYMPLYRNEKFDYLIGQLKISISNKNTNLNKFDAHYLNMEEKKKKIVNEYIKLMRFEIGESKFEEGKEIIIKKGLINDYEERFKFNVKYFLELGKAIPSYENKKFEYMNDRSMF